VVAEPIVPSTEIAVRRADPIYMAHGYLTKVPVDAIIPFIGAFTEPGDLIVDPFAGSGMTGVAAAMTGRRARLSDISVLGHHIGANYVNLVAPDVFSQTAARVLRTARHRVPGLYSVPCARCGRPAELIKATWSQVYACGNCGASVTYYRALEAASWKPSLSCPCCGAHLKRSALNRVSEALVQETLRSDCARKQVTQEPSGTEPPRFSALEQWPNLPIGPDREMFYRSALAKHGLTTTAAFFSRRNLTALVALREAIMTVADESIRGKLMFAFTSILPRASKRYQWSRKRPLNAQNQTYYISPVFYEWNIFDLFERKIQAALASDDLIRSRLAFAGPIDVTYDIASAHNLSHLMSDSADYIFTDPPFGSNIFYSDMSLFQEAWLGDITDRRHEAVISTAVRNGSTAEHYETLLTSALRECQRVLKSGGWLSMVFSNSRGEIWGIAQRALRASGLELVPTGLTLIDKGQRSVKGLASGWEDTVTADLVFTARKPQAGYRPQMVRPAPESVSDSIREVLAADQQASLSTPSRVYLATIRRYIEQHWELEPLHFQDVVDALLMLGYKVDPESGRIMGVDCGPGTGASSSSADLASATKHQPRMGD
jgi:DNA-directed RNA polymerase subunit RPC12/RpoP